MSDPAIRWNAGVRLALAARSVDHATADTVLDEVAQHCADSGENPEEAFGPPEEYAAAVAGERLPPGERLRRIRSDPAPRAALRNAAAPVGLAASAAGAGLWAVHGLMLPLTPGGLAGSALIAVALAGGGLVSTVRNRRRRALGWAAVAAATVLGAAALTSLSARPLGHLPAPLLCLPGLALLRLAARHTPSEDPKGVIMKPGTDAPNTGERELWLVRLPRLLEERHAIPRARAAELTAEATGHLDATGRAPEEEFGPVELYALRLSEGEAPRAWWKRGAALDVVLAVILTGYLLVGIASGGPFWQIALAAGALAVNLAILATRRSRGRPGVPAGR